MPDALDKGYPIWLMGFALSVINFGILGGIIVTGCFATACMTFTYLSDVIKVVNK